MVIRSPFRCVGLTSAQPVGFKGVIGICDVAESGTVSAGPGLRSTQATLFVAASRIIVGREEETTAAAIRVSRGFDETTGWRAKLMISNPSKSAFRCQPESPFNVGST